MWYIEAWGMVQGWSTKLYIMRGSLVLEDSLFFSLYSFSCLASNSTTLKIISTLCSCPCLCPLIRTSSSVLQSMHITCARPRTLHQGLLNPKRQVVLLISVGHLYPPCRSHLNPLSLSFSSTTPPSLEEYTVKSSLSISL